MDRPLSSSGKYSTFLKVELDIIKSKFLDETSIVQTSILRQLFEESMLDDILDNESKTSEKSIQISHEALSRLRVFISRNVPSSSQKTFEISQRINTIILGSVLRIVCNKKSNDVILNTKAVVINENLNISLGKVPSDVNITVSAPQSEEPLSSFLQFEKYSVVFRNLPAHGILSVRYLLDGDKFSAPLRGGNIKVSNFLRDQNVPLPLRKFVPLVILNGKDVIAVGNIVASPYFHSNVGSEISYSDINHLEEECDLVYIRVKRLF
jgi:tRNA(Ile)-lysidine synthetase-like protein